MFLRKRSGGCKIRKLDKKLCLILADDIIGAVITQRREERVEQQLHQFDSPPELFADQISYWPTEKMNRYVSVFVVLFNCFSPSSCFLNWKSSDTRVDSIRSTTTMRWLFGKGTGDYISECNMHLED